MASFKRKSFNSYDCNYFNQDLKNNHKMNNYEQVKEKSQKYKESSEAIYGNYHQYYGYRNRDSFDTRNQCMKQEWFLNKDVLDIGCNAGHFTLSIARNFHPRSIVGIDIDSELVKMAMKNVRHYVTHDNISEDGFPISLALSYGPAAQSLDPKCRYPSGKFPYNVQFVQANYILPSDDWLDEVEPYFDTILCLSLTKWIHLNWGDAGIKRLFLRIFKQLHAGGYLILEAQTYQSYAKRKKLTEKIYKHYKEIELFPEMFNEYLLKEVGFATCELVDIPAHSSKGFSRPIYLFKKASATSNVIIEKKAKHIIYNSSSEDTCDDSDVERFSDSE